MNDKPPHTDSVPTWFPDDTVDDATTICHAQFDTSIDPNVDPVVLAIVDAVAAATNDDVFELPPLFEAIDSEALTELMATSRSHDQDIEVFFPYQGCHVIVSSRGDVVVLAAAH